MVAFLFIYFMKTHVLDYIVSSVIAIFLLYLTTKSISLLFYSLTFSYFQEYHIVIDSLLFLLLYGVYSAAFIRLCLFIYPIKSGVFSMNDSHFFYWKLITVIHEFGRGALLPYTTVFAKPLVGWMFGAKMGRNIAMGGFLVDPWLITVADNAILGLHSAIISHAITSGKIILKPVTIRSGATVGVHCIIMPGVTIGENSVIVANSVVTLDTHVPPNELWGGSPAKKIKNINSNDIRG